MLHITKLPKTRTHVVEFNVTWTGPFPVALMAKVGARPTGEQFSYPIENSLRPYVEAREATARLKFYTDDAERVLGGGPSKFGIEPDGLTHRGIKTEDWHEAGCRISRVTVDKAWHRFKYAHIGRVAFHGDFPFDMLRYDDCALLDHDESIANLLASFDCTERRDLTALVVKWTEGKRSPWPSQANGRWASFRAFVNPVQYEDVQAVTARV